MSKAFVTGLGQDGSYLAEYLHGLGYEVWVLIHTRRADRIEWAKAQWPYVNFVGGDILDGELLKDIIGKVQPDEVYNMAGFTHAGDSFTQPRHCFEVNAFGAQNVFSAVLYHCPGSRVYQASSSELFGNTFQQLQRPLKEGDPFSPISPYGLSKLYAHMLAEIYRQRGIFVACGIAFNHQSPRGDPRHVNRKVTLGLLRCKLGLDKELRLGNLAAQRDYGYAPEYVKAFHAMLQPSEPKDYVIATGRAVSVEGWLDLVASYYNMDWRDYVVRDNSLFRPRDIQRMVGDPSMICTFLGWPAETHVARLAAILCAAEEERIAVAHHS